jgi:hypothetical protein
MTGGIPTKINRMRSFLKREHIHEEDIIQKTIELNKNYPNLYCYEIAEVLKHHPKVALHAIKWTSEENEYRGYTGRYDLEKEEITQVYDNRLQRKRRPSEIDPRRVAEVLEDYENAEECLGIAHENLWLPEQDVARVIKYSSPEKAKEIFDIARNNNWSPNSVWYIFRENPKPYTVFQIAKEFEVESPREVKRLTSLPEEVMKRAIRIAKQCDFHPDDVCFVIKSYPDLESIVFEIARNEFKGKVPRHTLGDIAMTIKYKRSEAKEKYGKYIDFNKLEEETEKSPVYQEIENRFVELINLYMQYGFFRELKKDDHVKKIASKAALKHFKEWGELLAAEDWFYLAECSKSISHLDTECFESEETYKEIINDDILPITKGELKFDRIDVDYCAEHDLIKLILNGKIYEIKVETKSDYVDIVNLLLGLNHILEENGFNKNFFAIETGGQDVAIIYLEPTIKSRLEAERNWKFY